MLETYGKNYSLGTLVKRGARNDIRRQSGNEDDRNVNANPETHP